MKYLLILILTVLATPCSQSQTNNAPIRVGDSYAMLFDKIVNDPAYQGYEVTKNKDLIVQRSLLHGSLSEYHFTNNKLISIYLIEGIKDPYAMLSFIYQNHTKQYGKLPQIINTNGVKMYYWGSKNTDYQYYYVDYSEWYQTKCFFTLTNGIPIKGTLNK